MATNNNNNLDLILKSIDTKKLATMTRSKAITQYMTDLINTSKLTKLDIIKATCEVFQGIKPITISTYLTDAKNVKYCRFSTLANENSINGIFSFTENKVIKK